MENKIKYSNSDITDNNNVALRILNNHNLPNRSISKADNKYYEDAIESHRTMELNFDTDDSEDIPCKKRKVHKDIKKLTENKLPQNEKNKRKLKNITSNDIISPLKRLKIETSSNNFTESINNECTSSTSKNTNSKGASKFIAACQEISSKEFYDIKSRVGISVLPDCCVDTKLCQKNHGKSSINPYKVLSYEQEAFKINFQAKMWSEALNVCKDILRPDKYPSVDILLCIIEIILNSHNDAIQKQSLQMILQRCSSTFKLYFSTHPPCSKIIRRLYVDFLTKPLKKHNENIKYTKNGGIFEYVLDEMSDILENYSCNDSKDDVVKVDTKCDISLSLSEAYLLKTEQETYTSLSNGDKIKRLFLVLDIIVDLLERDLAIWMKAFNHNPNKIMFGPNKTLMAWILWNENPFYTGTVNSICRQIFSLFVKLIKLEFPSINLRIFSRLINVLSNTYYLCEKTTECIYPNIGKHMNTFVSEMFTIIKDENILQKMKIISHIETKSFRFLLSSSVLKTYVDSNEENFIDLVMDIFRNRTWLTFPESPEMLNTNSFKRKFIQKNAPITETKRVFARIVTKLKLSNRIKEENKLNNSRIASTESSISMQNFLLVLYVSLKSYLDLYNVENIHANYSSIPNDSNRRELRDRLINNEGNKSEKQFVSDYNSQILLINTIVQDDPSLTLSEDCLKHYRLIFKILKQIVVIYTDLKCDRKIHDFFKYIQIIQ